MISKIHFAVRVFIGTILLISGILKTVDIVEFKNTILSYSIFNDNIVIIIVILICLVEIIMGVSILLNIYIKVIYKSVFLFFLFVTAFAIWSVVGKKEWTCNCFGSLFSSEISFMTILRNVMFACLSLFALIYDSNQMTFKYMKSKQKSIVYVLGISLLLGIVLYTNVFRDYRKALKVGDIIPDINDITITGDIINTKERAQDYLLLTVFSEDDCVSCLDEGFGWKDLEKEFKNKIQFVGIGSARRRITTSVFIRNKKIPYPIIYDSLSSFKGTYNLQTPIKILLNQNNVILSLDKSNDSKTSFDDYKNMLKRLK